MWKDEGISEYKAAKTCGIPVGTLRDRTTRGHCNPYKYKFGTSPLLNSTEETALVAHVKDIAVCGYGYTRRELAELAGETALVAHVKDIAACGYGYTRRELAELAGETALVTHMKDIAACGYGYTRRELAELAGETALVAHVKDIAVCGYGYTRRELAVLAGETALVAHVKDIAVCGYGYTRRELAELAGETALVAHVKDIAVCGYGYTRRELAELAGETALVAHVKDIAACGCGYTKRELAELAGETALVAHVKDIAACGYGYTRRELAELAGETAFFLNKRDKSTPLHNKWVFDFLKRWPELKIMKPKGLCMVRAHNATRETLDNYYKELLKILQKYELLEKPHRIFNVDETGISTEHIPPKIVAPRGRTPLAVVSNRSATTTIISIVIAIGQVLPPYIIFKAKRMCNDLLAGVLSGTQAAMSKTGWANTKVFQMHLHEHFLKYVPTNKDEPLLLLYDRHSSHINVPLIEWAQKHNIILFMLPAHTSHLLQPLDVGVFGPFKVSYYNECRNYLRKHPGQIIT